MRQAEHTQDQSDDLRQLIERCHVRRPGRADKRLAELAERRRERAQGVEVEPKEHQQEHRDRAADQKSRLDDLDPAGRQHATDHGVRRGQHADDEYGHVVLDVEQQRHDERGSDELRNQVDDADHNGAGGHGRADGRPLKPRREYVGEGEASEVSQGFGDDQHREQESDRDEDSQIEPVESGERDGSGHTEK